MIELQACTCLCCSGNREVRRLESGIRDMAAKLDEMGKRETELMKERSQYQNHIVELNEKVSAFRKDKS
jgi:predicted nuclease with TOPRIM domain